MLRFIQFVILIACTNSASALTPLQASPRLRIMPLEKFVLITEFNQALKLKWNEPSGVCYLQKTETTTHHLTGMRKAIGELP
jgi:hypothetical protein